MERKAAFELAAHSLDRWQREFKCFLILFAVGDYDDYDDDDNEETCERRVKWNSTETENKCYVPRRRCGKTWLSVATSSNCVLKAV